jgi:WD40 repeat protein
MNIFSFFGGKELYNATLVCKAWKILTEDDMLWRFKTIKHWKKTQKNEDITWRQLFFQQEQHEKNWFKGDIPSKILKGKGHSKCVNAVIFNDTFVVSASDDKKIKLWDSQKAKFIKTLKGHTGNVNCLSFAENSNLLFSGASDNTVRLWDTKNKRCLKTLQSHTEGVTSLQCRGSRLVSASLDKLIKVWDISTGTVTSTLEGHKASIHAINFVDQMIVSCSADSTIKVFDIRMEKCIKTLEGHKDEVTCLQFDKDTSIHHYYLLALTLTDTIISGSADKTLKEWHLGSGACVNTFQGHTDWVRCCSFDNNKIISGSADKTIKVCATVRL